MIHVLLNVVDLGENKIHVPNHQPVVLQQAKHIVVPYDFMVLICIIATMWGPQDS